MKESSVSIFSGFGENVTALSAPVSILCPEKIGQSAEPYLQDNYLFAPYGTFPNSSIFTITSYDDVSSKTIQNDTIVYVTKRELVDGVAWGSMIDEIYKPRIEQNFDETIGGGYDSSIFTITAEAENDNEFLYSIFLREENYVIMCKINKSTYAIEYLGEFYNDDGSYYVNWQSFSELHKNFQQILVNVKDSYLLLIDDFITRTD